VFSLVFSVFSLVFGVIIRIIFFDNKTHTIA